MANERLYLACRHCLRDPKTKLEDCVFYFAKYYPSTGWYTQVIGQAHGNFREALDQWFDQHVHQTLFGQFITLFESQAFSTSAERDTVMQMLGARFPGEEDEAPSE